MPNRVLTDEDIKLLNQTFATKDEVRAIVRDELLQVVGTLPTKEEFTSRMDQLAGEYQNFSTDAPNLTKQVSDHESRLGEIEEHLGLTA
jgi:hypothetical protein